MVLYVWQYINGIYQKTALIDYASSAIWVQRFVDAGEFELYVPASRKLLELFTDQTILTRAGDDENAMIFEKISLTTDDENGDYLTITGRSLDSIIERRIVPKQTSFTGTAENCIRKLLTENIISPRISLPQSKKFAKRMNTGSDAVLLVAESFLSCIRGQIEAPNKHLYHRLSSLRNLRTLGKQNIQETPHPCTMLCMLPERGRGKIV